MLKLPEPILGEYKFNYPLAKLTWFKVGGPAEVLFKPLNTLDLAFFLKNKPATLPYYVLGAGSNIIIRDGGIDNVTIKLGREFSYVHKISPELLAVGAATLNYNVVQYCMENSIAGFEFMIGIPGSVGGGVKMNAGAYGSEFKDIISSITAIDSKGNIVILSNNEIGFSYRKNSMPEDLIVVEAVFNIKPGNTEEIRSKVQEINEKRNKTQPVKSKTAGSIFKGGNNYKAWELIEKAGLRGYKIGDAQISELHCNFMINTGNSTAKELESLGNYVRDKVFQYTGETLEWEIKRVGKELKEEVV